MDYVYSINFSYLSCKQKVENRVASDEDLKLSDTLRYYMRDSSAAKNLLYRRRRCLANYEAANKNLDKARAKNRDVGAVSYAYLCHKSLFFFFTEFYRIKFLPPWNLKRQSIWLK